MAGYIRQSSFANGDAILAEDHNAEYDALVSAYSETTGHSHSGAAGEGPVLALIGDAGLTTPLNKVVVDSGSDRIGVFVDVAAASVEQVRFQDGSIVPVTTNDVDLGTALLQYKDVYVDGTANIDSLVLTSGATVTAILDEDAMTSNSATALATQQSIKAYVDAQISGTGLGTMATQNANAVAITGGSIAGITDLAVLDGGTGASTAADARTNLGLGTIATQAASAVSITGGSVTGITDLAVLDGGTGSSTASGARTNLGLGTIATQAASAVSITGGTITGITDLAVADGGTGASTLTGILKGNGTLAVTAVTAPSGTIVGTSDTQTLTNKTIAYASNTLTGVQETLVSGTNINTLNGDTLLGDWDISIPPGMWIPLTATFAVTASSVDIAIPSDAYTDNYVIVGQGITLSAADTLRTRFNLGGGYITTSTYYSTASLNTEAAAVQTSGVTHQVNSAGPTNFLDWHMDVNSALAKTCFGECVSVTATPGVINSKFATTNTGTGVKTGVRYFALGGATITGTFILYGVKRQ